MASLKQTSITGSLLVSGSSIIMPNLSASVDSGSGGQMWIDDSAGLELKFTQVGSYGSQNSPFTCLGAWSAGGNLSTARYGLSVGSVGTQNAGLVMGGRGPGFVCCNAAEAYDGSSWTSVANLANATHIGMAFGVQDAAATAGGYDVAFFTATEEYNGSSWSAGGAMIIARQYGVGAGSQNAGLVFGNTDATEEYNGTSWAKIQVHVLGLVWEHPNMQLYQLDHVIPPILKQKNGMVILGL